MRKNRLRLDFCNIIMTLNLCQFKIFHNYLQGISKNLDSSTSKVELMLVREELKVIISLSEFLQLCNGVQLVMVGKFGFRLSIPN